MSNFNKNIVINGFVGAIFFSSFIYLEYFGVTNKLIYSINAIIAIYLIFKASRPTLFVTGFFVGIFWFYWIGLSMRYYDLTYLIPFVVIAIGFVYGFIFLLFGIIQRPFYKIIALYFVQYLSVFDFDWFKPQLMLVNSYFGIENFHFDFLMVSIAIAYMMRGYLRILAFLPLIFSIDYTFYTKNQNNTKIYLSDPKLDQAIKWNPKYKQQIIDNNYKIIQKAITQKYDVVVLPEASFVTMLNMDNKNLTRLKKLSNQIGIITGGLRAMPDGIYNSTYIFEDESLKIVNKYVLVPFGEYIPLPNPLKKWINKIFFNGATDYKNSKKPNNFIMKDIVYRNAICYEATNKLIYQDNPSYIIATSNNSWFTPSIQPSLQRIILKFYAKKYKTIIYHSANMGKSGIITP
jgi:apolipoprotein N-acyltransferase